MALAPVPTLIEVLSAKQYADHPLPTELLNGIFTVPFLNVPYIATTLSYVHPVG